jgi:hypothetical protein
LVSGIQEGGEKEESMADKVVGMNRTICAEFERNGAQVAICWRKDTGRVVFARKLTSDVMYKDYLDVIAGLTDRGWVEKSRREAW